MNLLELVGLKDKAQAFPVQLSGGNSNGWRLPVPWLTTRKS